MKVRFAPVAKGWVVVGGSEDDESLSLNVMVQVDDDAVKRYEVRLPINVEQDELAVGNPDVTEV